MTKIDIFSGFLGAGKTTLIKKLIKEAYAGEKLVLIENELNSGCICCSLVGDFAEALNKVYAEYRPDRILIEPSGVGKLSDVIRAVESANLPDSVINAHCAVVDAVKCKMYMKNFGEFFNDQIESASCIIFSHTDVADADRLDTALKLVREHNPSATVVTTPWNGLDGKEILGAMERSVTLESELKQLEEEHEHGHGCCHHHEEEEHEHGHGCCHHHEEEEGHGHHHHHADEVFVSWGAETGKKFGAEEIKKALESLDGGQYGTVLRAKGIVACADCGEWIHFDYIPGEHNVRRGCPAYTGRLCVIGSELDGDKLKALFGV